MAKLRGGITANLASHLIPVKRGPKPSNAHRADYEMA